MSGRIPQQFIDDLLARTDIIELIGGRVDLKKAGRNYKGLCPFHNEKTPSFNVNPDRQFYHCFGCGASGSAIGFLLEYENMEFRTVVEELARQAGMEIPESQNHDQELQRERQNTFARLAAAQQFYRHQLRVNPHRQKAIDYLKSRGLTGEIANTYGIGYAPPGWDNLRRAMVQDEPDTKQLIGAGLLVEKESGENSYDRFRDRIMFPIRDTRGRTLAFGGRVLGEDKPKYLNSPETVVFHKGRELYGLYEVRQANSRLKQIIIVEGYMDAVVLAQHGITNAVATLGTATSQDHLGRLFRYVSEVVFCFDGDTAGRQAAARAMEVSLPALEDGRQISFIFLPEGEDPDSLVRKKGRAFFEMLLDKAMPLADFFFSHAQSQHSCSSIDGKASLSKHMLPLINKMPRGVFRQLMLQRLAELTGVNTETLSTFGPPDDQPPLELYGDEFQGSTAWPQEQNSRPTTAPSRSIESLSRKAIRLLLKDPELAGDSAFESQWPFIDDRETTLLLEVATILRDDAELDTPGLVAQFRERGEYSELAGLAAMEPLLLDPESRRCEFLGLLNQLGAANDSAQIDMLHRKLRDGNATQDEKETFMQMLTRGGGVA